MVKVTAERKQGETKKAAAADEAATVAKKSKEVEKMARDAQADLDQALPAFDAAVAALNSISKSDLDEIKSYKKPPLLVMKVMECVCTFLGTKETTWDTAKRVLGDLHLIEMLVNYDKDAIPPKV